MSALQQLPGPFDGTGHPRRRRLGDLLVEHGLLTDDQLRTALATQKSAVGSLRRRLGQVVVDLGYLGEHQLAQALADLLGLELIDLRGGVEPGLARLLPRSVAERSRVLVVGRSAHGLRVAAADPTNVVALDDVRIYTGASSLQVVVATESAIRDQLARAWSLGEDAPDLSAVVDDVDLLDGASPGTLDDIDASSNLIDSAPTVRLVNGILAAAVHAGASDVHVEPQADGLRIRYRVDGVLRDVSRVPRAAAPALISRLKIVSGLDIAERRLPQDGRARLAVDGVTVDARVSTLPAMHGEKVVVRLLATGEDVPPVTRLGLDAGQLETLLGATLAPQGLVLITGPTGSGKTLTLYSVLSHVATADKNVVTLEDPVEIQLPGITQVQINERAGLTFGRGLRSVLRQDPDVVLVGEVRDTETAELALQASLTGHLVLTTLHTNDSVAALTRLVDMGVEPFLVASSLSLVVAQRLVRKPCPQCAEPYAPSARVLAVLGLTERDLADATPRRGHGCPGCAGTGYRGRVAIFEVLPVTASMRAVLLHTPTEAAVGAAARAAGMTTLRAAGLDKARRGETTFEEVLRVTQVDTVDGHRCAACDRAVAADMTACPWCATVLDRGHCTHCSRPLEPGWRICPWCRTATSTDRPPGRDRGALTPRLLVVGGTDLGRLVDEAAQAATVAGTLPAGTSVDVVPDADAALAAAWERDYDGMLVAQTLPDLSGGELLRLLRGEPHTAALPLMLVRSNTSTDGGTDGGTVADETAADDLLVLPAVADVLAARLRSLVDRSSRLGQLQLGEH